MKYLTSTIAVTSVLLLNLSHTNLVMADSFQASTRGSKALSSGLSTASAGALQLVSGVISVPVQVLNGVADVRMPSANTCQTCTNAFPVADEIIMLESIAQEDD